MRKKNLKELQKMYNDAESARDMAKVIMTSYDVIIGNGN